MKDKEKKPDGVYGTVFETGKKALAVSYHVVNGMVCCRLNHPCDDIKSAVFLLRHKFGIKKSNIKLLRNQTKVPSSIHQIK